MPPTAQRGGDPRRQHPLPRRGGATTTTPSGASTSASSASEQVLAQGPQGARRASRGHYPRSLEIGAGTGYFTLNLLRAGADRAGHLHRHLRGHARDAGRQRAAARPGGADACPPTPSACRSRTRASTSCSATPCCTTSPTCRARSRSSRACSRRAARCCSPASRRRYGDRLASVPKRAAGARRAAVARAIGARPRAAGRGRRTRRRRWRRRRRPRVRAGRAVAASHARRAAGRAGQRRGAAGELVRLDQPHARGDRRARRRAVGVAPVRLPRLPAAAAARPPRCWSRACRRRSSTT